LLAICSFLKKNSILSLKTNFTCELYFGKFGYAYLAPSLFVKLCSASKFRWLKFLCQKAVLIMVRSNDALGFPKIMITSKLNRILWVFLWYGVHKSSTQSNNFHCITFCMWCSKIFGKDFVIEFAIKGG
jgi:hypothetical protein